MLRALGQSGDVDLIFRNTWVWGKQAAETPETDERWRLASGFRELSMTYGWCVTQQDEETLQV